MHGHQTQNIQENTHIHLKHKLSEIKHNSACHLLLVVFLNSNYRQQKEGKMLISLAYLYIMYINCNVFFFFLFFWRRRREPESHYH